MQAAVLTPTVLYACDLFRDRRTRASVAEVRVFNVYLGAIELYIEKALFCHASNCQQHLGYILLPH
jgi:hypothetical protein